MCGGAEEGVWMCGSLVLKFDSLSGISWGQLVDSSTLKREVAEGVDIMVVRELTGGQYRK